MEFEKEVKKMNRKEALKKLKELDALWEKIPKNLMQTVGQIVELEIMLEEE